MGVAGQTIPPKARGEWNRTEMQQRQCKLNDDHETDSTHNSTNMHRRQISVSKG